MTALLRVRRAGKPARPSWSASLAVRAAARPLPAGDRGRYRQEFVAALYGMSRAAQLHHATGVISRAWTLRVALNEPNGSWPRRPPWQNPCAADSDSTAGNACATPKAAGTANASSAESKTTPAVGEVPIPLGRLDLVQVGAIERGEVEVVAANNSAPNNVVVRDRTPVC
jgi:hypothetical protein